VDCCRMERIVRSCTARLGIDVSLTVLAIVDER
jgi:hypothetical protein